MARILNYSEKDFPALNDNAKKVISRKKSVKTESLATSENNNIMSASVGNTPRKYHLSERITCDSNDERRVKCTNSSPPSMERHRCVTAAVEELLSERPSQISSKSRHKISNKVSNIVPGNNPLDSDKPFRFKGKQKLESREKRVSQTKTQVYEARQEYEKLKDFSSKIHVQGEYALVSATVPNEYISKCLFSIKRRDIKDYMRKFEHCHQNDDANSTLHESKIRNMREIVDAAGSVRKSCQEVFNVTPSMSNNAVENENLHIVQLSDVLKRSDIPPYEYLLHTRSFKRYCDNDVTNELNESVEALISQLVRFQCNKYRMNPTRAVANKRYVIGLKQVKKYVLWNKVKLIVITPDMEDVLQNLVEELKSLSLAYSIPYLFALSRRKLGYLARKKVGIACFGILDASGAESNFKKVLDAMLAAKKSYKEHYSRAKEFYEDALKETDTESLIECTITDKIAADFKRQLHFRYDAEADEEN